MTAPDHSAARVLCPGCGRSTNLTVTFRNARGEVVTHCLGCGGAESTPDPKPQPTLAEVKPPRHKKRPITRGNLL